MHTSVRGIIPYNNGFILVHRKKPLPDGSIRDYYVVPGGKVEQNETLEQALIREIYEEVGINVIPSTKLLEFNSNYDNSIQIFYKCNYISGKVGTGNGPELHSSSYKGEFIIEIIEKNNIKNINLVPEEVKIVFDNL